MTKSLTKGSDFKNLLGQIRGLIISARRTANRSVDILQVLTNFRIGQAIVEHEQQGKERAEYGKKILEKLSEHLTSEFGTGFSLTNLKLMRQFYFLNKVKIGQTVSGELVVGGKSQSASGPLIKAEKQNVMLPSPFNLSWSHYVFLMGIADEAERKFYEIETSLKIGKLTHQDLGQMQMYVNYFDRYVKKRDEHPTVGMILCKRKSNILVEVTLPKQAHIYASEYKLYLPSKAELKKKLLEWSQERG